MKGKRFRLGLVGLLLASFAAVFSSGPAAQGATGDLYGDPASATVENLNFGIESKLGKFGFWVKCTFVGYWRTSPQGAGGGSNIHMDMVCKTGIAVTDHPLTLRIEAGDCSFFKFVGNVDDDEFNEWSGWMSLVDQQGCGPVTQLCVEEGTGDDVEGTGCYQFPLGVPPLAQASAGDSGNCPYASSVPAPPTYEVYGTSTRVWKIVGTVDVTTALSGLLNVQGVWKSTATGQYRVGNRPQGSTSPTFLSISGTGAKTVTSQEQTSGWSTQTALHEWKLVGISMWLSGGTLPSYTSAQHNALDGPTMGITNGAHCKWYWGENFRADDPVGTYIPPGPNGNLDGPVGTEPDGEPTPPVIDDDPTNGCDPAATLCVDPGPDPVDTPSVPDPDDESCNFSITDPSTWGGQVICALAAMFKGLIGMLGQFLEFLMGLVAAIGDLLATLFIPDPSSWGLDGLIEQVNGRAPFSIFSGVGESMGDVGSSYADASGCTGTVLEVDGVTAECGDVDAVPGFSALKALVGAGLIALTAWYIFSIASSIVEPK